ncbi:hypothetical protein [Streptomyces sp. NPDC048650]|uniref:hypothetical protein n=1 Tax=unclassified Streptomyces TaxID=2593676 RepID=UPI0037116C39
MRTVGVTGHMDLAEGTDALLRDALGEVLGELAAGAHGLVGVSCIAPGADSLFAEAVLACGSELSVVLPFRDYRRSLDDEEHRARFDRLMEAASHITVMPYPEASLTAFEAANTELLQRAEILIAVWDGEPSEKGGGTAAVVAQAREAGMPVHVVWPPGARRRSHPIPSRERSTGRPK